MHRFLAKLRSFFWSWGFLEFLLALLVLFILVYLEEDWRGAHNWAVTKAKWEAQGESFDPKKFIPPPVPDEQNIAALPLFKLQNVANDNGSTYPRAVTLRHALRDDLVQLQFVPTGYWIHGEPPDMAAIQKIVHANYTLAVKNTAPPDDALAQLMGTYPFLSDFLLAAGSRPYFRVNYDYAVAPPASRSFDATTQAIGIAKVLSLHAVLAIDQHQPDLALQDIKINLALALGAGRDPSLVGGLVALGIAAINNGVIYDGLAQHAWNDTQLADLDHTLKPVDFLAGYQFSTRAETVDAIGNLDYYQQLSRSTWTQFFWKTFYEEPVAHLHWPSGWWDDNKSRIASFDLNSLAIVDPKAHLCFPSVANKFITQANVEATRWDRIAPWKILSNIMLGPLAHGSEKFTEGQVAIDQMRIACALERYRLAHNAYPDSLDALAPAYLDAVPHDPLSGQAYRYHLRPDGTFLLYSVGWNQTDDAGTIVMDKTNPKSIDYDNGDWVWPTPKLPH